MILISACLAGIPCRYDGNAKTIPELQRMVKEGKAVPVCPEVLGGLRVPRTCAEIKQGKVVTQDGMDLTSVYEKGSRLALQTALEHHCELAVLKEKSPACGVHWIHDGSFTDRLVSGRGTLTDLLNRNGIPCLNEDEYKEKRNESV